MAGIGRKCQLGCRREKSRQCRCPLLPESASTQNPRCDVPGEGPNLHRLTIGIRVREHIATGGGGAARPPAGACEGREQGVYSPYILSILPPSAKILGTWYANPAVRSMWLKTV